MKYREIEYWAGDFCERKGDFCEYKSPMGWCECEEGYFERNCRKTVDESFYELYKKLGRIPTLQEFIETTNLGKTSYYRARQKYKLGLEKEEELKRKRERYAMTKKINTGV